LSNGKANTKKSLVDEIIKLKRQNVKSYGQQRQKVSSGSYIGSSGQKGGADSNINPAFELKTSGDTMVGPIAFYPRTQTIVSGIIDVSAAIGGYSSRVLVIGQGGSADNLEVILGAGFAGQILFFQPLQAVTLQSYLKTATAWASGTSYNIGDVVLDSNQRYTCYTAHTSSSATDPGNGATWKTVWYRNNIRITGATEQVVAIDEIILLQYDSTDSVWTVVSGGGSTTDLLPLNNIWTGANTFTGSPINFNSNQINLGDNNATDNVFVIATMKMYGDFNANTYDMYNIDRLKFGTTAGSGSALAATDTGIEAVYSGGNSYGMKTVVPANNIYQMFIASSEKVTITTSSIVLNNPVTIGGSVAIGDNYMEYGDMTSSSVGTTPANKRRVFSDSANNDELSVKKSDGSVVSLEASGSGASLSANNQFTGSNTFTGLTTTIQNSSGVLNALTPSVNLGTGAGIISVIGQLGLSNVNTAPSSAGRFTLDGTDVKVYTGGGVKNLSDIGTGGGGVSLGGTNTWTGQQTFSNQNTIVENDLKVKDNVIIEDDLQVYDDCTLGSSTSDDCVIKGRLDLTTNAVVGTTGYPSVALGFITVKIGGNLRNIFYS